MSRVTYKIDRYACDELEELRKMRETCDFSGMLVPVERLQQHYSVMEAALWQRRDLIRDIRNVCKDEESALTKKILAMIKKKGLP